jgi:hypothetical protein
LFEREVVVGRRGFAGRLVEAGSACALEGSRSRPKAVTVTPVMIAIQAAKKSDPALKINESDIISDPKKRPEDK